MFQKLVFNCAGILNFEPVCIAPVYAQALLRRRLRLFKFIPKTTQESVFNCAGILNFEPVCIAPVYAQALLRRRLRLFKFQAPAVLKFRFLSCFRYRAPAVLKFRFLSCFRYRAPAVLKFRFLSCFRYRASGVLKFQFLKHVRYMWRSYSPARRTSMKADWGMLTLPISFIRFLPFFCFSQSLRLRVISPP